MKNQRLTNFSFKPNPMERVKLLAIMRTTGKSAQEVVEGLLEDRHKDLHSFVILLPLELASRAEYLAEKLGYDNAADWLQRSIEKTIPEQLAELEPYYGAPRKMTTGKLSYVRYEANRDHEVRVGPGYAAPKTK